jgi:ABC-type proline/glycine betaine transport system permease subunit
MPPDAVAGLSLLCACLAVPFVTGLALGIWIGKRGGPLAAIKRWFDKTEEL